MEVDVGDNLDVRILAEGGAVIVGIGISEKAFVFERATLLDREIFRDRAGVFDGNSVPGGEAELDEGAISDDECSRWAEATRVKVGMCGRSAELGRPADFVRDLDGLAMLVLESIGFRGATRFVKLYTLSSAMKEPPKNASWVMHYLLLDYT